MNYVLREVRRRAKEIKELEKEIGNLKLAEEQRKALGRIEKSIDEKRGEVILLQGPRGERKGENLFRGRYPLPFKRERNHPPLS